MSKKTLILVSIFILGIITPFIPEFTVFEMFFLLIPFALIFISTFFNLVFTLIKNKQKGQNAIFIFSILPLFILSQLFSGFVVGEIQNYRCEKIITDIDKIRSETGEIPNDYQTTFGIKYEFLEIESEYQLEYERGFMVKEKYNSKQNEWNSFGWND